MNCYSFERLEFSPEPLHTRVELPPLEKMLIWLAYFGFTWASLWLAFSRRGWSKRYLLVALVLAQFLLKLVDRYFLPSYPSRAGDENIWIVFMQDYEKTGVVPYESLAQGPGIFYATALTGNFVSADFTSALVILAVALGSLYVLTAFLMYEKLSGGKKEVALGSVILVSMSDVMIYSTTVARPTLFGLFLIPLAVAALQTLFARFRWLTFLGLLITSILILVFHTPITYLVLLLVLTFTLLIYDRITKWKCTYALIVFSLYGVALSVMLPDLDRIWRTELLGTYPLSAIPSSLGPNLWLLFPLLAIGILLLSWLFGRISPRVSPAIWHAIESDRMSRDRAVNFCLTTLVALAILCVVLGYPDYQIYIRSEGGDPATFELLHGWKLPFILLAVLGIRTYLRSKARKGKLPCNIAVPWLLSIVITVLFLAYYSPLKGYPFLWNLDERFAEFGYYPAFYFIALELYSLERRLPTRVFNWIILPLISLFAIPSIIVGTRDLDFTRSLER